MALIVFYGYGLQMYRYQHLRFWRGSFDFFDKGFNLFLNSIFLREPVRNSKIIPMCRDYYFGEIGGLQQSIGVLIYF